MKVVEMNINDLIPYENNPRINDNAVDKVVESIKQFGFKVPIIIDKDNVIVAGHTRHKAAKTLKLKTVPCVVADDLTDEQVKALRLADNKVSEFAEWDFTLLEQELAELDDWDMSDFGFDDETITDTFGTDFELDDSEKQPIQQMTFTLHDNQADVVASAIDFVVSNDLIDETFGNDNKKGNALYKVVKEWAEQKKLS